MKEEKKPAGLEETAAAGTETPWEETASADELLPPPAEPQESGEPPRDPGPAQGAEPLEPEDPEGFQQLEELHEREQVEELNDLEEFEQFKDLEKEILMQPPEQATEPEKTDVELNYEDDPELALDLDYTGELDLDMEPVYDDESDPALDEIPEEEFGAEPIEEPPVPDLSTTEELDLLEQQRLADMTRTVQVSIEQIINRMDAAELPPPPAPLLEEPEEGPARRKRKKRPLLLRFFLAILRGIFGVIRWLLLVVFFVAIIAGCGVYWLYQGATAEMLPTIQVKLEDAELPRTAYDWEVPVVASWYTRNFAETLTETPYAVSTLFANNRLTLSVTPMEYDTAVTVWDQNGTEVFTGSMQDFNRYRFPDNGTYRARLVLSDRTGSYTETVHVTGSQTYDFTFAISVRPSVRFDSSVAYPGGVLALMVTGIQPDDIPMLDIRLENSGFLPSSNGWVAYIPVPRNLEPSSYTAHVYTKDYVQDVVVTIGERDWNYEDYDSRSQLFKPYLALADTPKIVKDVLGVCDQTLYWAGEGFTEPYTHSVTVALGYGTVEYVGRSKADRDANRDNGNGRYATNTVLNGRRNDLLVAPGAGRVLVAERTDDHGYVLVIEHGGGIKSIFYELTGLEVEVGDVLAKGQEIGTAASTYIVEARVGAIPVDPLNIWRNKCNAMLCY